jgi:hypothetical protein
MKRAKVIINKSIKGDMVYNIYRFKNETAKRELNYYIGVDPIFSIDESILTGDYPDHDFIINDLEATMTEKNESFITYSAPYEFINKSSIITFKLKDHYMQMANVLVEVVFGNVAINEVRIKRFIGETYELESTTTDQLEIMDMVVYENNSAISLAKSITKDYQKVTLSMLIARKEYIDMESNGVFKHQFSMIERVKDYEIHPKIDTQGNLYSYAVIGVTPEGKISQISNISTVSLAEDPTLVNQIVEYSDTYTDPLAQDDWSELCRIKSSNIFRIDKADMYSRRIPKFAVSEIKADDTNLQVYGERILKVPNIWHKDKQYMSYRNNRSYRFVNEYNGEFAEPSEVITFEGYSKVNIDKLVIYKKRVTYLSDEERKIPIEIGDKDAELLKVYVRLGGIYYSDAIVNMDNQPIEILSSNSKLPLIQIKDHCLYSNHYNYTVYLYDEKGKQSDPACIVM